MADCSCNHDCENCDKSNELTIEDELELDLALWRALNKSTTLISYGRLIDEDKTKRVEE